MATIITSTRVALSLWLTLKTPAKRITKAPLGLALRTRRTQGVAATTLKQQTAMNLNQIYKPLRHTAQLTLLGPSRVVDALSLQGRLRRHAPVYSFICGVARIGLFLAAFPVGLVLIVLILFASLVAGLVVAVVLHLRRRQQQLVAGLEVLARDDDGGEPLVPAGEDQLAVGRLVSGIGDGHRRDAGVERNAHHVGAEIERGPGLFVQV
mmetsp:Transcript_19520/g.59053  ORF Transcript_19520/g.59053 Transcript_19520/m.59053 type:complete len:209 (-) Transcript_19520:419-1045(-)